MRMEGEEETEGEWRRGGGKKVELESAFLALCYNWFPGRPDKAGAKIDNNCCRASLDREHVGSLSLNQWVEDKQVKRCIRLEVCKLTRRA
jgi:hypothetical protein